MRKPTFTLASIRANLGESLEPISNLRPIAEGGESQAFKFETGAQTCVLRINYAFGGFEKDALAAHKFARPNLPIPKVLRIGPIEDAFYCVSENAPGTTLQDLPSADLPQICGPTASVLEAIAESDLSGMTGCGPFDANGAGANESWNDFLLRVADTGFFDWGALRGPIRSDVVEKGLDLLHRLVPRCPETRQLIHGDFGADNVLTEGGLITGVIDWSEASIGDPLYDVANVFFWRTWLDCMEQQARCFDTRLHFTLAIRDRLLCYQLRIGLAEIYENALAGNTETLAWATARCRDLLQ